MKISVPDFVSEANVQEAIKRFKAKGISFDATILAGTSTAIGLLEKLRPNAANVAGTLPVTAGGEPGEIDPRTVLPSLTEEQLKFMQEDAVSRGMKLQFTSSDAKFASDAAELIRLHPKREITVALPGEAH
jgi:hypothetical protein